MNRVLFSILLCGGAYAADWPTFGGDAQRTGWARDEDSLGKDNVKSLTLLWKYATGNQPKELNGLTAPVVAERVFTPRGVRDIVVVAGASDNLYAIDGERGTLLWSKTFQTEGVSKQKPHWLCPNALNATPMIQKGGVGRGDSAVYAIASDGKLHTLNLLNGEDVKPVMQFVPPFSKNWSLNLVNGVLYTAVSQGCNGAKSGVYAMDLKDEKRPVRFWMSAASGGGVWGRAGVAVDPNGLVLGETGDGPYDAAAGKLTDTIFGLSQTDLKVMDYYTPANRDFITKKDLDMGNTTPVIFPYEKWTLAAGAGKEGLIYLLDTKSLGGESHRKPLYRSPLYTNEDVDFAGRGFWGAFATCEDGKGTRWLFAPAWGPVHPKAPPFPVTHGDNANGSIMAFKVATKDGAPVLAPAWISRDLDVPEPPIVANGIVFAVSNGENVRQLDSGGHLLSSKDRIDTAHGIAVLYAFDAETGQELYNSGKSMTGWTHFSGLAIAGGRVFVSTFDGTVYGFGLKQE
jgi:outer membrane protein assembly factor BamB